MNDTNPSVSVEALLAHQSWVRALAHSLVRDPATADDLSQEAMLAALRSPPRHEAAIRSWFRRVLRSRLVNLSRQSSRRAAREAVAARPEAAPALEESMERVKRHRQIVDLVLALRSPFRETVVLRYFDELTPREIGERLGVPASTVRSRLTRAMAMLRDRLDEEHGGDRRAWQLALLPLLKPRPMPAAAAGTALVTGGWILMAAKSKILVTTLALLVAVAMVGVLVGDDGDRSTLPRPELRESGSLRAIDPTAIAEADTSEDAVVSSPDEGWTKPKREVRVRVTLPDGTAAVGARVCMIDPVKKSRFADVLNYVTDADTGRPEAPSAEASSVDPVDEAVTDARGEAVLVPARSGLVRVQAHGEGLAAVSKSFVPRPTGTARVTLRLGPAVDIHGTVTGPDGRRVEGARVMLGIGAPSEALGETRTDRDGQYSFPGFPLNADWISVELSASAEGYARRGRSFDRKERPLPGDGRVDLLLANAIEISGRCVDERGVPLPGIAVVHRRGGGQFLTGQDGRFRLRGVDVAGAGIQFFSRTHGFRQLDLGVTRDLGHDVGDVTLVAGEDISGQVVDGDGKAVPNAMVQLHERRSSLVVRRTRTDEGGDFRFSRVGNEPLNVVVRGPISIESWASGLSMETKAVTPGARPLRIILAGGKTLLVKLKRSEGAHNVTIEKVLVRRESLSGSGRSATQVFVGEDTTSVRVDFDVAGPYRITVWVPGCEPVVWESVEIQPDRPTEITAELRIGGPSNATGGGPSDRGR